MKELKPAILMTLMFGVFAGLVFPFLVYGLSSMLFPSQAFGSLQKNERGAIIGSSLIGQMFTQAKYFHGRPSAAGSGYDALASGGSNLGPISAKLIKGTKDDVFTQGADETFLGVQDIAKLYREENKIAANTRLPADAVTRSASGLDPDISVENALLQASRVASARNMSVSEIRKIIDAHVSHPFLGIFGEPRINVLAINLALDKNG